MMPILTSLIMVPCLGAMAVTSLSRHEERARYVALFFGILSFALSVCMWDCFDPTTAQMQFVEQYAWLPSLGLQIKMGVDGITMPLIVLTAFINMIILLMSWRLVKDKVAQYLAVFLVMQAMTVGVFCALDAILFYLFWEGMLIPMYLCIGIWGGENKTYAAVKFFLYTFFASALLLIALLYLGSKAHTFDMLTFFKLPLALNEQVYILVAFLLAFAVKVPMWPVHTWLPDAHTEAPAAGSVILAALMLKVGAYGFFRFALPITPDASHLLSPILIALSLVAIVYIGLVALVQTDMKRLIAYSSVAHMGFVSLGCFMIYLTSSVEVASDALMGAMVQMVSHGFGSGAMFLAFGLLYERYHTRDISSFGGVANKMPFFTAFFVLFCLTNVGLPGTAGFVGEFMVILSSFDAAPWITILAALTLIIGAGYTLNMVRRVFYGPVVHDGVEALRDLEGEEWLALGLLAFAVFALGLYPNALITPMKASVDHLAAIAFHSKIIV